MPNVGFTGTRRGMTGKQQIMFRQILHTLAVQSFHHGDCLGADFEAHEIVAHQTDAVICIHPPSDPKARAFASGNIRRDPKPYLDRNKAIVDESDILIATPGEKTEQRRSGTWSTIRYARKSGKKVVIIFPDGSAQYIGIGA